MKRLPGVRLDHFQQRWDRGRIADLPERTSGGYPNRAVAVEERFRERWHCVPGRLADRAERTRRLRTHALVLIRESSDEGGDRKLVTEVSEVPYGEEARTEPDIRANGGLSESLDLSVTLPVVQDRKRPSAVELVERASVHIFSVLVSLATASRSSCLSPRGDGARIAPRTCVIPLTGSHPVPVINR